MEKYLGKNKTVNLNSGESPLMFTTRRDTVTFVFPVSPDYTLSYPAAKMIYETATREYDVKVPWRLEAIKILRTFTSLGLKESKDVVEYVISNFNYVDI